MRAAELALQTGRLFQKEQTGFVHLCYQSKDGKTHDTIPILENALFALSLFRTRLSDEVLEGISIIDKLLAFEVEGNFPVYLHEYPQCSDPYLGIRLLPILFWILHDYSHVLGELKEKIRKAMARIVENGEKGELPNWAVDRLQALKGIVPSMPTNPIEWGEALITLQIAEVKGGDVIPLLKQAWNLWNPELHLYVGECERRDQLGGAPTLSLFGLYLSSWHKSYPKSIETPHRIYFKGALVRPLKDIPTSSEHSAPFVQLVTTALCPLYIGWKGRGDVHTFALARKHLEVEGTPEELLLTLPEEIPEDEDRTCEVNFFFDYHEDHKILVNGKRATTFHLGDLVEIHSEGLKISLRFSADEGSYFGHLMRGNRPSQHGCVGEANFAAFDWRLALRTVSRKGRATIRVQVALEKMPESRPLLPLHASHCPHTESSL